MTYTKLPDEFTEDPRVVTLSDRAFRLHVSAFVYANRNLTDGLLASEVVGMLTPRHSKTAVQELVAAGLWANTPDGYAITDFHRHQLTRDQVLALRTARSDAGRVGGLRSADTRRSRSTAAAKPEASAEASAEAKPYPGPVPVPVRERSVLASLERAQSAQTSDHEGEEAAASDATCYDQRLAPQPGGRDPEGGAVWPTTKPEIAAAEPIAAEPIAAADQIIATANEPWRAALTRLRAEMTASNFANWFTSTYLVDGQTVVAPNDFTAGWLREHYACAIASALGVPAIDVLPRALNDTPNPARGTSTREPGRAGPFGIGPVRPGQPHLNPPEENAMKEHTYD